MFVYAAVMMLSLLAIQPTLASAEEGSGRFTLAHEVTWQKQTLRAGTYTFSVRTMGPSSVLFVRSVEAPYVSAMMLINDVETAKPSAISELRLVSQNGQSYVEAMSLPQFDVVLKFRVPTGATGTETASNAVVRSSTAR